MLGTLARQPSPPSRVPPLAVRGATAIVAVVLAAGVLAACSSAPADGATDGVLAPLCEAIAAADGTEAAEVFESRAHQPLHELADEVAGVDRDVAARLLEAKFAVETVVRDDAAAPDALVRQRLEDLAVEVRAGLTALDRPAPDC